MKVLAKVADAFFKSGRITIKLSIDSEDIISLNIKKKQVGVKILSLLGGLDLATRLGLKEGLSMGSGLWDFLKEMDYKLVFE